MATADWYRDFAVRQAHGESPSYERLSYAVIDDAGLLERLDTLPEPKRQPNLLFAATRLLGGPTDDPAAFRAWVRRHWDEVSAVIVRHRTQTNEAGRCAVLLPVLAALPQPLALLEVGTSAGLCLYPDRYRYTYGDTSVGPADSPVRVDCAITGDVPVPTAMPTVVWRAGLDLNPLDIRDDNVLAWLDALVWPEHEHRRTRLHAAARLAREDPPSLTRGDLRTDLRALASRAPADATLVVFHTSALAYVTSPTDHDAFAATARSLPGHWISNESPEVFNGYDITVPEVPNEPAPSVLALDERPLALSGPHGQYLRWLDGRPQN